MMDTRPLASTYWVRHFAEMMLAMMVGMAILTYPVGALAGVLGYRDLNSELPAVATLVMAFEMTLPMVLWMGYRGHGRRGIVEMSAAMVVPAIVLVAVAEIGLIGTSGMVSTYHVAMLAAMVALLLYRRAEYSGQMSATSIVSRPPAPVTPAPNDASGPLPDRTLSSPSRASPAQDRSLALGPTPSAECHGRDLRRDSSERDDEDRRGLRPG